MRVGFYILRDGVEHKLCGEAYYGPTFPQHHGSICCMHEGHDLDVEGKPGLYNENRHLAEVSTPNGPITWFDANQKARLNERSQKARLNEWR